MIQNIVLLSSSSEWVKMFSTIIAIFAVLFFLVWVYSKITDSSKMSEDNKGCGWPIFLIIVAIIVGIVINAKGCSRSSNNDYEDSGEYWDNHARHTYNTVPQESSNAEMLIMS